MQTNAAPPNSKGYRFPPEIISQAVCLSFRFSLRYRDGEELMAHRDASLPLRVRWEGWIAGGAAQQLTISGKGHVRVSAGTVTVLDANNPRPDFVANKQRLFDYVKNGGNLIVQYQRGQFGQSGLAPFPVNMADSQRTAASSWVTPQPWQ